MCLKGFVVRSFRSIFASLRKDFHSSKLVFIDGPQVLALLKEQRRVWKQNKMPITLMLNIQLRNCRNHYFVLKFNSQTKQRSLIKTKSANVYIFLSHLLVSNNTSTAKLGGNFRSQDGTVFFVSTLQECGTTASSATSSASRQKAENFFIQ